MRTCSGKPDPRLCEGHALTHTFAMTSPALLRCVFLALRILQLTTLYSGHIAKLSLTLEVMRLSIISGKWKVLLRMPDFLVQMSKEDIAIPRAKYQQCLVVLKRRHVQPVGTHHENLFLLLAARHDQEQVSAEPIAIFGIHCTAVEHLLR